MNGLNEVNRYPALSAIAVVFKVMAVLVAIVGVLMAVLAMKGGYDATASILIMVAVVVSTVVIWAIAESIAVIIDIEANTRASATAARHAHQEPPKERLASGGQERLPPLGTPMGTLARNDGPPTFNVVLVAVGPNKNNVVQVLQEITTLGLTGSLNFVNALPKTVKERLSKMEADTIATKLRGAGADVNVEARPA